MIRSQKLAEVMSHVHRPLIGYDEMRLDRVGHAKKPRQIRSKHLVRGASRLRLREYFRVVMREFDHVAVGLTLGNWPVVISLLL